MQLLPTLDNILYNVQRQGKISFYVSPRIFQTRNSIQEPARLDDLCKPKRRHFQYLTAYSMERKPQSSDLLPLLPWMMSKFPV